jgi:hypothetical protein
MSYVFLKKGPLEVTRVDLIGSEGASLNGSMYVPNCGAPRH